MDEKLEFKINQFEGPLDLLLHLIDKNKFNIFDIPIVEITEQYLDYLNRMQEENLDVMSEFLVMAATLISIKAKINEIFTQVMKRTVDRVDPVRSKFGTIEKDEVRIEDKMDDIRASIRGLKGINFKTLLEIQATKINIIVTFMAILELMKVGDITIRQDELFGDIIIDSLEA